MLYTSKIYSKFSYKRITFDNGLIFNIHYSLEYCNSEPIIVDTFIPEIFRTFYSIHSNFINKNFMYDYVINIWYNDCSNIPVEYKYKKYHIDNKLKMISINLSEFKSKNTKIKETSDCVSRIISELYCEYVSFEKNTYMKRQWKNLRGHVCKTKKAEKELFIEDFKMLFFNNPNSTYSFNVSFCNTNFYTDKFQIAKNIKGLKSLMSVYLPFNNALYKGKYKYILLFKKTIFKQENEHYLGIFFIKISFRNLFKNIFDICCIDSEGYRVFNTKRNSWETVNTLTDFTD